MITDLIKLLIVFCVQKSITLNCTFLYRFLNARCRQCIVPIILLQNLKTIIVFENYYILKII